MDTGQIRLAELLQQLQPHDAVSFRLALWRMSDKWQVHTLVVESFPEDEGESAPSFDYNYGSAHFINGVISGATAVAWLSQREGSVQSPEKSGPVRTFALQQIGETIPWIRYPSHSLDDYGPVRWPYVRYDATGYTSQQTAFYDESRFLLADECPFFPNFKAAVLELIHRTKGWYTQPNLNASPAVIARIANTDAWLNHITLSPTAITARVNGTRVAGARLVISAPPDVHFEQQLQGRAAVKCPLSNTVPSPLWIVLSRGNDWLDYYHRDERWPTLRRAQGNVTIDPGDARNEIEALIAQGEGPETEFKRELGADKKRFLNTVSAFANTVGGTIIIGIDDTGTTHGIVGDVNEQRDAITRAIRDNIVPMPEIHVTVGERDSNPIMAVYVGRTTAHACGVNPADPRYYVRRGANNFPARPEEITQLVLDRHPQSQLQYLNRG